MQCIPEMPTGIKLIHQLGMGPTQEAIGSWYIPTFPKRQMSASGGDHGMPTEPSCSLTIVLLFSVPPIHVLDVLDVHVNDLVATRIIIRQC